MDISADDVRRLLGIGEADDPVLILIEGRLEIVPAAGALNDLAAGSDP